MSSQVPKSCSDRAELALLSGNVPGAFASPPAAKGVKTPLAVRPASPSADSVPEKDDFGLLELDRCVRGPRERLAEAVASAHFSPLTAAPLA